VANDTKNIKTLPNKYQNIKWKSQLYQTLQDNSKQYKRHLCGFLNRVPGVRVPPGAPGKLGLRVKEWGFFIFAGFFLR